MPNLLDDFVGGYHLLARLRFYSRPSAEKKLYCEEKTRYRAMTDADVSCLMLFNEPF